MERSTVTRIVLVGIAIALVVIGAALLVGLVENKSGKTTISKSEFAAELQSSLLGKSYLLEYILTVYDKSVGVNYTAHIIIESSGRGVVLAKSTSGGEERITLLIDDGDKLTVCKALRTITMRYPVTYMSTLEKSKNVDILAILLKDIPSRKLNLYDLLMVPLYLGRPIYNGSKITFVINMTGVKGLAVFNVGNMIIPLDVKLTNGTVTVHLHLVKEGPYNPLLVDDIARLCITSG